MKNFDWKRLLTHLYAIGIFLIIAVFYCKPALQGKVLQQTDITQWKAMAADVHRYKEAHGEAPLWANNMFSGMPDYLIATKANNVVPYYFAQALSLFLAKPFQFFFLACVCFYFLSQVLRVNAWVGIIGSLAYAYATYNPVIIVAGHDTKMMSIALLPGFIASLILIYEKRYWWGATLTAFFTGSLVSQNHYQITYYALIIAVIMTVAYVINWIIKKEFKHLLLAAGITLFAGAIGALSNAVVLFPDYEYTQATIRGGSELGDANATKTGLKQDYAFDYSMFKTEPFVMLVPRMFGGSSNNMEMDETKSKAVEALQSMPQELARQIQGNLSFYWGGIGGTSGPPYVGAIVCFLAILGFIVLDSKHKWWILATSLLSIVMSWGGYFPSFNGFLLNHLPMYNKFRAPSMTIVIPTFLLCMIAVLGLQKLLFGIEDKALLKKQLRQGMIATAGVFAVLFIIYFSLDYTSQNDTTLLRQIATIPDANQKAAIEQPVRSFINGLKEDRQHLFLMDIFRSLFFIAVAAGALWLYERKVLQPAVVIAVIGLFAFIDVTAIDNNYLKSENFEDKEENEAAFNQTPADQAILQDKSWYRVLDVSRGISAAFNAGALSAYYHKSVGGYHPAKLSIYQDLIEHQLYKYPNNQNVLDMLNTKYIIENPNATTVPARPTNLGPVWFVKGIRFVNNAKDEMAALDSLNTRDSAVANKSFSNVLKGSFTVDPAATIRLVKNENDVVTYASKSSSEQPAVFSEVYYDKGWHAYIDGKQTPIAKVNYVLRALMVPAGEHTIVFKFEPASHAIGWTITGICSAIMILMLAAAIFFEVRNKKQLSR